MEKLDLEPLHSEEIEEIRKMKDIFELIASLTDKFQSDKASLSCVIPNLMDFKMSVSKMEGLSQLMREKLLIATNKRFEWALKPSSNQFIDLAALATYLDNAYKIYLEAPITESMELLKAAKRAMLNRLKSAHKESAPDYGSFSSPYLEEAFKSQDDGEITQFDPKEIKEFVEDLSAVPCSQAHVERIFSVCTDFKSSNKRGRILPKNFEKRIIYIVNSRRINK
ncbi:hypothetical protein Ciccas_008147 [Cichlidogyrus casuarinus]|uniref:HAT C-terminal dimerisation domain-containing protein n=1 Tax=Cichlidogyrus casuarinus TaxID=1844966 RepID=A0ABD2Q1A2_9PLAT